MGQKYCVKNNSYTSEPYEYVDQNHICGILSSFSTVKAQEYGSYNDDR